MPEDIVRVSKVRRLIHEGTAREIRERAHLSLSEVARHVGRTPTTIHRWENGERLPRREDAIRYGRLLERLAAQ